MATKHFLFGNPPFRFLAEHLAQDDEFLDDARQILGIGKDQYLRLKTQLAKSDAFLSRSDVSSLVKEVLGESDESSRIATMISRVGEIVHDAELKAKEAMDALGDAIQEKTAGLESQERETLILRLRELSAEPIGIAKQYKARQLVDVLGAELDDFKIVCDIRPIFDQQRERIEGAVPITSLRLDYTKPNGDSSVVELRLTEKQLAMFEEKITDATRKLKMIKQLMSDQNLRLPRTKATVSEDVQ